jgi:membrane protein implicated in regulation of membrane protease activity
MVIVWLAIAGIFLVVEIASTAFYAIFIAFGSLVAFVSALIGAPVVVQLVLFVVFSLGTVLSLRNKLVKAFKIPHYKKLVSGIDGLVGSDGIVVREVLNNISPGKVKVHGESWLAITYDKEPIVHNDHVTVIAVESGKLVVAKIE